MDRYKIILYGLVVVCFMLLGVALWQFVTINLKKAYYTELQVEIQDKSQEIELAREKLNEVSSIEAKELNARKRGWGYTGERRFYEC